MLVQLSKNSWHAKYYKWVKGFYPTYEFKSLCPYFWTLVFYILCSPLILLWKAIKSLLKVTVVNPIGKYIDKQLEKKYNKPYKKPSKVGKWWDRNSETIGKWVGRIWVAIMVAFLLLMVGIAVYELFSKKGAWLGIIYIFAVIGVLTTFILLGWLISEFSDSDAWKMIKGMSFSVKNKVCPMIKWDEENYEV